MLPPDIFEREAVKKAVEAADAKHMATGGHYTVWINYHTLQTVTDVQGRMPTMDDLVPLYDTEEGRYEI